MNNICERIENNAIVKLYKLERYAENFLTDSV